ncbi:hypothetical protein SAMN05444411_102470 [Lutibacter oricola]|uniref:Outer membrane protein beta-barrel domain-containing protein n=1 Tax=Lutibacter oricola TaxID=762486 RepID=A0A1H2XHD9_9FLAO|nr:hypothetical protein [Lutibacter oricola]SDW92277.1 hypothetical protein SAMN05444411_102470 [Lutibacter oricola]
MNTFTKISLLFAMIASISINAQKHHEEPKHTKTKEHGKHKLAFFTGFTHVSSAFYEHETHEESTGKWVPTIGLDYFYSLNKKWSIGTINDIEFDNYIIKLDNEEEEERVNVLISSVVAKYNINHQLGVFIGPGVEVEFSESTKNFFVVKAGVEYEIEISNGWEIAPSLMYDWKEEYKTFSYGFSIGKRF